MKPVLFSFTLQFLHTAVEVSSYLVFLTIGFIIATFYAFKKAPFEKIPTKNLAWLVFFLLLSGMIGARVFHVLLDGQLNYYVNLCIAPYKEVSTSALVKKCLTDTECGIDNVCYLQTHICHPTPDCWAALKIWQGGFTYYGGFLFAALVGVMYARTRGHSFLALADFLSPAVAIGLVFGRIGCFLNGCCYGRPTKLPWGIRFPRGSLPFKEHPDALHRIGFSSTTALHPTQLYEALGCLFIFIILFLMGKKANPIGKRFGFFLYSYSILRFACEFFREDTRGKWIFDFSISQVLSIFFASFGLMLWLGVFNKNRITLER